MSRLLKQKIAEILDFIISKAFECRQELDRYEEPEEFKERFREIFYFDRRVCLLIKKGFFEELTDAPAPVEDKTREDALKAIIGI